MTDRYDIEQHRRDKVRRLEAQVEHLTAYRAQLERLLGTALRIAVRGTTVTPATLLATLEDLDAETSEIEVAA